MSHMRVDGGVMLASSRRSKSSSAARSAVSSPDRVTVIGELFEGVTWSPSFVALLYFLVSITTFRLNGADIAAAICITGLLIRPDYLRIAVPLRWFAALVLWAGLGVVSSRYQSVALESSINLGKLFLVAVMLYCTIRTKEQLRTTVAVCVFSFLLFPFRGAMVNFLFGYSLNGRAIWNFIYANPNDMAALAILFASIAAAGASLYRHVILRFGLLACALAFAFLVVMTQSRGATLGLALAGVLTFVGSKQKLRVIGSVIALLGVTAIFAPSSVWDRFLGLSRASLSTGMEGVDKEGSAAQRFQIAQVAFAVGMNQPILGVGVGTYPLAHARQAAIMSNELPDAGGERDAHNTYLSVFAELGVPGLLFFFGILGSTAFMLLRMTKRPNVPPPYVNAIRYLGLGLLAYCFAAIFGSFAYINMLYVQVSLICLLSIGNLPTAKRRPRKLR